MSAEQTKTAGGYGQGEESAERKKTVVIIGHGTMAANGLRLIKSMGVEVPLVIADAADKGEDSWRKSFVKAARELGYVDGETLLQPNFPHSPAALAKLKEINPTLILSLQCQKIIRMPVIACAKLGVVNCHNAPLPLLRGCDPFAWAIHDGLLKMGITLHQVLDEGIDNGPILCQRHWPIEKTTTAYDLFEESLKLADTLIKDNLQLILDEKLAPHPQEEHFVTYHPMHQFAYKLLAMDWTLPVVTLSAFARARIFPIFQMPTFQLAGRQIEAEKVEVAAGVQVKKDVEPGTVMALCPLTIAARWGALYVHKVRVDGDQFDTNITEQSAQFAEKVGFGVGEKAS